MALIKCKECGQEISDKAKVCMNCGVKTKFNSDMVKRNISIISIILIAILSITAFIAIYNNDVVVKSINKSIDLLKRYKKGEIDIEKLVDELEQLSDDIKILSDNEKDYLKSSKLSTISVKVDFISYKIHKKYIEWNSHKGTSDSQIDKYIEELKGLK